MLIEHKDATIVPTGSDDDFPGTFEVILSTPSLDRDGDMFRTEEWKTPLPDKITFDIDHGMSVATTVGSGVPSINDSGQLVVKGTYSSLKHAQDTRTLVNEGHIDRTSVAYITHRIPQKGGPAIISRELLNGAFVAIPANDEAKVLASKGMKAGARNNAADTKSIQTIHDHSAVLGAACASSDATKSFLGKPEFKSVAGSLEAIQDRANDALNDAYGSDAYVWLQATLPTVLVFQLSEMDSSATETYQQSYTDDGSVITLTGDRTPVDLIQMIKPDPDEETESAATAPTAAAAKAAAAAGTKAADDVDSDAVNAAAMQTIAASFIE